MSELKKMCNQYFGTHDFYDILKVKREANVKESMYNLVFSEAIFIFPINYIFS